MASNFQFMQSNTQLNWAIVGAAVAGLLLVGAGTRDARSEPGPFSALNGSWSGAGTIKKSNWRQLNASAAGPLLSRREPRICRSVCGARATVTTST